MDMSPAPLFDKLQGVPSGGSAVWLTARDGVRVRMGHWPLSKTAAGAQPAKGTVFILPGRTEWVEKYGPAAGEFNARGYDALAIDWRGQGIADKALPDRRIGHVENFSDYALDLEAVIAFAEAENYPKPWFLLGHSMGGAIGLRALIEKQPFAAAAFSGPMWGIGLSTWQKAMVTLAAPVIKAFGKQTNIAPGTRPETYMDWQGFEGNLLTADREMYALMQAHTQDAPELGMGGPSSHWVLEAIDENDWAQAQPAPEQPILCFLGGDEQIVDKDAVREMIARFPNGELIEVPKARHEFPMEVPQTRAIFYDKIAALFDANLS